MNSQELTMEIFQDYPMVLRKAMYLTDSLRRKALKSKNKYHHQIFDYKSSRKNNWLIMVDYYFSEPTFKVIVYYLNECGFNAMMVNVDHITLSHYSSHFLDRFNERFLKQENISKIEILKRFLSQNAISSIELVDDTDGLLNRIFARVKEGIGLGQVERINFRNNIIHLKTFISNQMIFESQQGLFNLTSNKYQAYWNEAYKHTKVAAF